MCINIFSTELEPTVKNFYRDFLQTASLAQNDRIDSYFNEWRIVEDVDGPFQTDEKQKKAFDAISQPSDFHVISFIFNAILLLNFITQLKYGEIQEKERLNFLT